MAAFRILTRRCWLMLEILCCMCYTIALYSRYSYIQYYRIYTNTLALYFINCFILIHTYITSLAQFLLQIRYNIHIVHIQVYLYTHIFVISFTLPYIIHKTVTCSVTLACHFQQLSLIDARTSLCCCPLTHYMQIYMYAYRVSYS